MERVKRAIIMAAGRGDRMRPVTQYLPKPLIRVNGKRMIETIIDALYANGIGEIHVVTGYLRERFTLLKDRYPEIDLIENPMFDTCNNISSLYAARQYLEDVMILDGDQIIYDPAILRAEYERSGYNAVWTDRETKEWLLQLDDTGTVTSCSRTGGRNGWQLYSISRWNREDGRNLRAAVEETFEKKKERSLYWDDVPLFCYPERFRLGIMEMKAEDVIEIDSYDELVSVAPEYKDLRSSAVIE
ncbi:MAG: NTP transferase domain-containing protein [Clostridia bacterium]|nr:NTP transferase domain-containing protein [Clostridia bacterium]